MVTAVTNSRVKGKIHRFAEDRSGTTAVLAGLALVPVMAVMGMSVDLSRSYLARTNLQGAVDAAALAGIGQYRISQDATAAQNAATSTFNASVGNKIASATVTTSMDVGANTLNVTASATVSTPLMGVMWPSFAQTVVGAQASAVSQTIGLGKDLEVALMLDVTSSMSQSSGSQNLTKLQAMQQAAKNLISTVVQTSQTPHTSRVALAPFSAAVNLGTYFQSVTGVAPSGSWTSVVERSGASNATEDPPSTKVFPSYQTMHTQAQSPNTMYRNLERNRTSNIPTTSIVVPLSSNKTTLNAAIDGFSANGTTAGHLGTAWTWYLLSPQWSSIWPTASAPAAYDASTAKVAVLMSDFDYNMYYQISAGDMNAQAAALCTNMKAAGITIYTIGFQVDHTKQASVDLFNNCATDASKAIEANTGSELISAFQTIGNTVLASVSSPVRLAQ